MDLSTQSIAYADDLLSVSSTITSLQQQADLVVAFAAIFELDLDGITSVRLSVSQFAYDKAGQTGLSRLQALETTDALFPAERGVPQGDVASPFGWNAVYDILLRTLTVQ